MSTVNVSGPLFDGRMPDQVQAFLRDAEDQVAAAASEALHRHMDAHFKMPTPYYEAQVRTERRGDSVVVGDRGIIYGPWLAGTSPRNRTTRFKGYPHWTLAIQEANAAAPALLQALARKHFGGGGS